MQVIRIRGVKISAQPRKIVVNCVQYLKNNRINFTLELAGAAMIHSIARIARKMLVFWGIALCLSLAVAPERSVYAADAAAGHRVITSDGIAKALNAGKGKRMVFVLYASWCPFCRQVMPDIVDIAADYPGQVVAVSVDKDADTFTRYLQKNFGTVAYTPYIWARGDDLYRPLGRFGIKEASGIPFTALLDEYGYVSAQGVIKPEDTRKFLDNTKIGARPIAD